MDLTNLGAPFPWWLIPGFAWKLFLAALPFLVFLVILGIGYLILKIIEWAQTCKANRKGS
jgi:hypothetical protein